MGLPIELIKLPSDTVLIHVTISFIRFRSHSMSVVVVVVSIAVGQFVESNETLSGEQMKYV